MRLKTLTLGAFGPFTNEHLDLSGGAPGGVHLIYGPNEAGKSTSLRAVSALLFGMPHQSRDAHLHPSADLRVSATLEAEGSELCVTRLKRRRDSLVGPDGSPLPEDALSPYLRGLDQSSFETRFGLDQNILEQGAEALLSGGEEGIFSAGTAGVGTARVLSELKEEILEIYRPRGQKYPLNAALTRLAEADKSLRFAERPPEKYQEQKQAHDQALAGVRALEAEQHQCRRELGRLGRLASVLSEVSQWQEAQRELQELEAVPLLGADAERRRQDILGRLREGQLESSGQEAELKRLEQALARLPATSGFVDAPEDRLALLRNQIGSELKARADLPKRAAKLLALQEEVTRLKKQIGQKDARTDDLLIDAPLERRVRSLIGEHARLRTMVTQSERSLSRVALDRQEVLDTELPETVLAQAAPELGGVLEGARRLVTSLDLAEERRVLADELERAVALGRAELSSDLAAEAGPEELELLLEQLRRSEERRDATRERLEGFTTSEEVARRKARVLEEALQIPTEAQLISAREERDHALQALASRDTGPDDALLRQVGVLVERSDVLADRLRREASRVSEHASLLLVAEQSSVERRTAEEALSLAESEVRRTWTAYQEFFQRLGLSLPAPERARATVRSYQEVRARAEELRRVQTDLSRLEQRVREEEARLRLVLPGAPSQASLRELLSLLESRLERAREAQLLDQSRREQIRKLERREKEERAALQAARAELALWTERWGQAMQQLGRGPEDSPEEIEAYLSGVSLLAAKAAEMSEMQRRVDGISRDTTAFRELVFGLAGVHAPDLLERDLVEAAEQLLLRAREAADDQRERRRLSREIEERTRKLGEAKRRVASAEAELGALLQEARVDSPERLQEAVARSERKRALMSELSDLREVLRARSGGQPLEELVREVEGLDHDELRASIMNLEGRQEELDQELRAAQKEAVALGQGLTGYATTEAAEARQRVSERRARALQELRAYLVRRAAWALLHEQVERYAAENQGPLLSRAREHFSRLTIGRYSGLRVGASDRSLWCVRDGKDVEVGGLSRGTRAQLYLALRLASLERHFQTHAKVPVVLDDLFVDFDDDRAAAAFELLGDLAETTQILYYTHLARDVEAADAAIKKGALFLHKLGVA